MKRKVIQKEGFTLVELIVVLTILGILIAISVPSFLGYLDRQHVSDAKSECHLVVAAAQSVCKDKITKNDISAQPLNEDAVIKLAGVKGKLVSVPEIDPRTYTISALTYQAENNLYVQYDAKDKVKYKITDHILPGRETSIALAERLKKEWLSKNQDAVKEYNKLHGTSLSNVWDVCKNEFLESDKAALSADELKIITGIADAGKYHWKPAYAKDGTVYLMATTGIANHNPVLIYLNGSYYYPVKNGKVDENKFLATDGGSLDIAEFENKVVPDEANATGYIKYK